MDPELPHPRSSDDPVLHQDAPLVGLLDTGLTHRGNAIRTVCNPDQTVLVLNQIEFVKGHSLGIPVIVPDLVIDSVQEVPLEVVPHASVVTYLHLGLEQSLQ